MSNDVKFIEQEQTQIKTTTQVRYGFGDKTANLIMKYSNGLIKDKKQAYYIIAIICAIIIIISFLLIFNLGAENLPPSPIDHIQPRL